MIGKGRDDNAGMAMVGLGLRFRPIAGLRASRPTSISRVAVTTTAIRRKETAFGFNGLVFLNPKSKTQVYLLAASAGRAPRPSTIATGYDATEYKYGYFGGQAGIGLEFRLSKVVALNFDFRGFVRGRVDDHKDQYPEFVDSNGRSTNTSGGGLFQGGLTFYW